MWLPSGYLSLFLILFTISILNSHQTYSMYQYPIFSPPQPLNIKPYSRILQALINKSNLVLNCEFLKILVIEPIQASVLCQFILTYQHCKIFLQDTYFLPMCLFCLWQLGRLACKSFILSMFCAMHIHRLILGNRGKTMIKCKGCYPKWQPYSLLIWNLTNKSHMPYKFFIA